MQTAQDLIRYWKETAPLLGLGVMTGNVAGHIGGLRGSQGDASLLTERPHQGKDALRGMAYGLIGDVLGASGGALASRALGLDKRKERIAVLLGSALGQGYGGHRAYREAYENAVARKAVRETLE